MTFPPRRPPGPGTEAGARRVPEARPAPSPGRPSDAPSPHWIPDRAPAPPREGVALADALRLANPRMPVAKPEGPGGLQAPGQGGRTGLDPPAAEPSAPAPRLGELAQVYNRARVLAGRRQALSEWLGPVLGPRVRLSNVRNGVAVLFVDSASLAVALRRKHADIVTFLVGRGTSVTRLDVRIAPAPGQGATPAPGARPAARPPRPFG